MEWFVRSFVFLVVVALLTGTLLLFFDTPYEILKPTQLADLANRGQFVQGVLTLFALLAALVTIIVSTKVESGEYKAVQQVKVDVVVLLSVLLSMLRKVGHFQATGKFIEKKVSANEKYPAKLDLREEKKEIQKFIQSPSAFAIFAWIAATVEPRIRRLERKSEEVEANNLRQWRLFTIYLTSILEGCHPATAATYAGYVVLMMRSISDADIRRIGRNLSDLAQSSNHLNEICASDPLIKAMMPEAPEIRRSHEVKMIRTLRALKRSGVKDPDIDFQLDYYSSVAGGAPFDENQLNQHIERGANPHLSMDQVLLRYSKPTET